jgi:hypothetical protein
VRIRSIRVIRVPFLNFKNKQELIRHPQPPILLTTKTQRLIRQRQKLKKVLALVFSFEKKISNWQSSILKTVLNSRTDRNSLVFINYLYPLKIYTHYNSNF